MGYTTEFTGSFKLNQPLSLAQQRYLNAFSETRRMTRDVTLTAKMPDKLREAVGLPVGLEGGYYVGAAGDDFGQAQTPDITNYNGAPDGQPGLWCQWVPTDDGEEIEWNGAEKFYSYVEWLEYIIQHFLKPWKLVLNGQVEWSDEEQGDQGKIIVVENVVTTKKPRIVYE